MTWPTLFETFPNNWKQFLAESPYSSYMIGLSDIIFSAYKEKPNLIYPKYENLFSCFALNPEQIKVVIIGQDPYHGKNQANGLCFSVNPSIRVPPSLQNIFKELNTDLGIPIPNHGDLTNWKNNGVLLLNTILTVENGKPASHQNKGWEIFTKSIIRTLSTKRENLVFMLWGNKAKELKSVIDGKKHFIIESAHPSPYSAANGFFGSKPFSKCNNFLISKNIQPIDWTIP